MSTPLAPIDDLDPGLIPFAPAAWPFLATLPTALAATDDTVAAFRKALADGDTSLRLQKVPLLAVGHPAVATITLPAALFQKVRKRVSAATPG